MHLGPSVPDPATGAVCEDCFHEKGVGTAEEMSEASLPWNREFRVGSGRRLWRASFTGGVVPGDRIAVGRMTSHVSGEAVECVLGRLRCREIIPCSI